MELFESDSRHFDTRIDAIKGRMEAELPADQKLFVAYLDARMDRQDDQIRQLFQVLKTGAGVARTLRWLLGIGALLASIWAAFHGKITIG